MRIKITMKIMMIEGGLLQTNRSKMQTCRHHSGWPPSETPGRELGDAHRIGAQGAAAATQPYVRGGGAARRAVPVIGLLNRVVPTLR